MQLSTKTYTSLANQGNRKYEDLLKETKEFLFDEITFLKEGRHLRYTPQDLAFLAAVAVIDDWSPRYFKRCALLDCWQEINNQDLVNCEHFWSLAAAEIDFSRCKLLQANLIEEDVETVSILLRTFFLVGCNIAHF